MHNLPPRPRYYSIFDPLLHRAGRWDNPGRRRSHGGDDGRSQGEDDGGRSHGEALVETGGWQSEEELVELETQAELKNQRHQATLKDLETKAGTSGWCEAWVLEDCGWVSVTEDRGGAGGKEEPNGAERVEGQGTAEGPEVRRVGRAMTDQGRAGGMRKPGRAARTADARAEEERNQSVADWSTGWGALTGMDVQGGARGLTYQGRAGEQEVQGGFKLLRGASERRVDGLKGHSGVRDKELDSICNELRSNHLGWYRLGRYFKNGLLAAAGQAESSNTTFLVSMGQAESSKMTSLADMG